MEWIKRFDLMLFDFDGLLVNTEALHFEAYREMCKGRGFHLPWDFNAFCKAAHVDASKLKEMIYADLPALFAQEPDWRVLYEEKQRLYRELLQQGKHIQLMPGVEGLLARLQKEEIKRCVVTNSRLEQIMLIRSILPALDSIPAWITRECYDKPKPDPECYLKAVSVLGEPGDRIVGFEDTMRGLKALRSANVDAVLICSLLHPQMKEARAQKVDVFESFEAIPEGWGS